MVCFVEFATNESQLKALDISYKGRVWRGEERLQNDLNSGLASAKKLCICHRSHPEAPNRLRRLKAVTTPHKREIETTTSDVYHTTQCLICPLDHGQNRKTESYYRSN